LSYIIFHVLTLRPSVSVNSNMFILVFFYFSFYFLFAHLRVLIHQFRLLTSKTSIWFTFIVFHQLLGVISYFIYMFSFFQLWIGNTYWYVRLAPFSSISVFSFEFILLYFVYFYTVYKFLSFVFTFLFNIFFLDIFFIRYLFPLFIILFPLFHNFTFI
jgi:hypothetical protein